MSDEIRTMKKEIKMATAFIIALYSLMLFYLLFPQWVINNIIQLTSLVVIYPLIFILFIAIATYFSIGDIHNWFDKKFFGERERVDSYIREQITKPCRDILCQRATQEGIIEEEKGKLIDLFYNPEFIPSDDTERERAFSYFTEYYITVNLSIASFLGIIVAIIIACMIPLSRTDQLIVFGFLILILPALSFFLRHRTKHRLSYPAEAQTARILNNNLNKLKQLLPDYRFYEDNTKCRESEGCPLARGN